MHWIDWIIIGVYFAIIIGIGFYLMLRQRSAEEYYMGARKVPAWLITASIVATQSSAVSLLGGPAFVAVRKGGGLFWLQYELAVPLAMLILIPLMVQLRRSNVISIYEYLELQYGPAVRFIVSFLFQVSRILATGVSLYATAILFSLILNISIVESILILGGIALLYTMLGGILADILSDFVQLIILVGGVFLASVYLLRTYGFELLTYVSLERFKTLDLHGHGWGDGHPYGFWPMLIGGLFLYLSYYGCDQSQSQRLLTGPDEHTTVRALMYNGISRFFLVFLYVFFGLLLAGFIGLIQPSWMAQVVAMPDQLVPLFIRDYFPVGARGLFMSAILAAAMSSFDSAYNSISAATFRDIERIWKKTIWTPGKEVWFSRILTCGWGAVSMMFAIWISQYQKVTVIELINMVGSILYGPIFAAFFLARFFRYLSQWGIIIGLGAGLATNLYVARAHSDVSWLWWNVIGFCVSVGVALVISVFMHRMPQWRGDINLSLHRREVFVLIIAFCGITAFLFILHSGIFH